MTDFILTRRALVAGVAAFGFALPLARTAFAQSASDISSAEAYKRQQAGDLIIVDIRTPAEWAETGIAAGALKIDMTDPEFVQKLVAVRQANPNQEIGLMCRSSNRSSYAQTQLSQAGFDRLYSVVGGMAGNGQAQGWIRDGLPTEGCC